MSSAQLNEGNDSPDTGVERTADVTSHNFESPSIRKDYKSMKTTHRLIVAMAVRCRSIVQQSETTNPPHRGALHPKHLLWMCDKIEDHAEDWPATKLHRWIGFVQCGMMANRMLDLDGAKAMFDQVQIDFEGGSEDEDLIDHLAVEMDIGGQG